METLPSKCFYSIESTKESIWSKIKKLLNDFCSSFKKRKLPDSELNLECIHGKKSTDKCENYLDKEGLATKRRKISESMYENTIKEVNQFKAISNKKLENKLILKVQKKPNPESPVINDILGLFKKHDKSAYTSCFKSNLVHSKSVQIEAPPILSLKPSKSYIQRKPIDCFNNLNEYLDKKREKERNYFKYKIRMDSPPKAYKNNLNKSHFTINSSSSLEIINKPCEKKPNLPRQFTGLSHSIDPAENNNGNYIQEIEKKQDEKTPSIKKPEVQTDCNSNESSSLGIKLDLQNNLDNDILSKKEKSYLSDLLVTDKVCEFRMTDDNTDVNTEANTFNQCYSNENTCPNIIEENNVITSTKNIIDEHQKDADRFISKLKDNINKNSEENPFLAKMNQTSIPESSLFSYHSNNEIQNNNFPCMAQNNITNNQIIHSNIQFKQSNLETNSLFSQNSSFSNLLIYPFHVNNQNNNPTSINNLPFNMFQDVHSSLPSQSPISLNKWQDNNQLFIQNQNLESKNCLFNYQNPNIKNEISIRTCLPQEIKDDSQYFTMGTSNKKRR